MEDSSNKVLKSELNKIDALPNAILYHILSFLDMKEVMATSIFSRRWRYLWESVSVLNFDHYMWDKEYRNEDGEVKSKRFMNFVDRVLFLRDGSKVNKFNIFCACDDSDRLDTRLTLAAIKQFQEVHLEIYANITMELCDLLFNSAITVFKLVVKKSPFTVMIPRSISSSPQLKTLILDNVLLPEGNSNGELILSCPVLENLTLKHCLQYHYHLSALIISTPQLKSLVSDNSNYAYVDPCLIKVWTPNLISLEWSGFWDKISLRKFSKLVSTKIFGIDGDPPNTHHLVEVLESLSCATTISIAFEVSIDMSDKLTSRFSNLRCLTLQQLMGKFCFRLVLKLLKNAPCLENLILETFETEDFEDEEIPFVYTHLKSVDFGRLERCENEVKFLKVLLKNAIALKVLIIRMLLLSSTTEKATFGKQIHSLARASSSLTVIVLD